MHGVCTFVQRTPPTLTTNLPQSSTTNSGPLIYCTNQTGIAYGTSVGLMHVFQHLHYPHSVIAMGISTQEPQKSFEQCWLEVRARVLAFCHRLMQNQNDAEDLFQEVAIRAWRGYSSFRGESSFSTWVLTIVRREATRRLKHSKHSLPLLQPETIPEPEPDDPVDTSFVIRAIKEAEQMHILNPDEAEVLQMRLQNSELTWRELGDSLRLSANACAVNHTRALPKLRVYLFMYRPEWLGGDLTIRTAFAQAQRVTQSPLSREEAEVFEQIVLHQNHNYSRSGWKTRLSSACTKVIRFIHLD